MMILQLVSCPPALRGDLTKWLVEIAAGVYVGRVSARVRDRIWSRVVENCKEGRSVLVHSTNNEQRFDFRIHGESWEPIDFDGIKLMLRPNVERITKSSEINSGKIGGFSNASKIRAAKRNMSKEVSYPTDYIVIDVETTGLNPEKDAVIELGAMKIIDRKITETFQALILVDITIPAVITKLTGLDVEILQKEGQTLDDAVAGFIEFCGNQPLIAHNMDFDRSFLNKAMEKCSLPPIQNHTIDTLAMAKRMYRGLKSYKLKDLEAYLKLAHTVDNTPKYNSHRSLGDCYVTHMLYQKLLNYNN